MTVWRTLWLSLVGLALLAIGADDADSTAADKAALSKLQILVGEWKGVGQLRRGKRSDGDWAEQSSWAWQFTDGRAAIVFSAPEGKYLSAGRITPGDESGSFVLTGTLPDGQTEELFRGTLDDDGRLVLKADGEPSADRPAQVTLRTVAEGDRLLVLYEKKAGKSSYSRLAEVGYTRKGSSFGKGGSGPECVVTGGYGTMTVEYQGKTYYVCCTGCRDLFNADPEGVLADFRARKEEERKSR